MCPEALWGQGEGSSAGAGAEAPCAGLHLRLPPALSQGASLGGVVQRPGQLPGPHPSRPGTEQLPAPAGLGSPGLRVTASTV